MLLTARRLVGGHRYEHRLSGFSQRTEIGVWRRRRQRLKAADEISEFLPHPVRKNLHIVVERPSTGELK
jgi:hypothetical protein